jgi:ATP-binding cassette subfamily B multidrug efflux pump
LLILLLAAAGMGCAFICQYYASIASQGVGTDIRNALFSRILSLGPAEIEHFGAQSLVNRLGGDVNQLQLAVAMLIRLVVRAPFLSIGGLIMAMLIDLRLSLIFMIVIPLFVLILYLVMARSVPFYKQIQVKLDNLSRVLRENLSGVRVIRAFARAETEQKRFANANATLTETILKVGRIAALLNPATMLILNAGAIAVLYLAPAESRRAV